jgi:hypothetical protein
MFTSINAICGRCCNPSWIASAPSFASSTASAVTVLRTRAATRDRRLRRHLRATAERAARARARLLQTRRRESPPVRSFGRLFSTVPTSEIRANGFAAPSSPRSLRKLVSATPCHLLCPYLLRRAAADSASLEDDPCGESPIAMRTVRPRPPCSASARISSSLSAAHGGARCNATGSTVSLLAVTLVATVVADGTA